MASIEISKGRCGRPGKVSLLLAALWTMSWCVPSAAEPVCFGETGCGEAPIAEKVQVGFARALNVVVGELVSIESSPAADFGEKVATFKIIKQYKGSLPEKPLQLLLDVYRVGGDTSRSSQSVRLQEFETLEREAEENGTENFKRVYLQKVKKLRERIDKYGADEIKPTYVLRINLSAFDESLRRTDVPLRIGQRYAIFIFAENVLAPDLSVPSKRKANGWALEPPDVYSIEGERGKKVLTALEQIGKADKGNEVNSIALEH